MKVDGVTPSIPTNGVAFLWRERTFPHSLEAIDQNYSSSGTTYMMRFYNWAADPDYSKLNIMRQHKIFLYAMVIKYKHLLYTK
ncbi:MAG: hypothetical protein HXY50_07360 [Ignavibacteriaceae bacterium]|nr:hypothetical protein [Ignavibacteriaceae bacterium]